MIFWSVPVRVNPLLKVFTEGHLGGNLEKVTTFYIIIVGVISLNIHLFKNSENTRVVALLSQLISGPPLD